MLNDWISCNDDFCADNHNYFQFKLKDKGRSAGSAATQGQVCGETLVLPQLQLAENLCRCAEFFFFMVIDVPVVLWCRFPEPSWWRQS